MLPFLGFLLLVNMSQLVSVQRKWLQISVRKYFSRCVCQSLFYIEKPQLVFWVIRGIWYFILKYHLFLKTFMHKARWGGWAHGEKDLCGIKFWAGRRGLPHGMWWQSLGGGGEDPCRDVAYHEKGRGRSQARWRGHPVLWGSLWWGVRAQGAAAVVWIWL